MPGQESHISGERFTSRQHRGRAAGLAAPSHLAAAGASAAEWLPGQDCVAERPAAAQERVSC